MKIIVLVKVIPKQIEFDKETKRIKRSSSLIVNPLDMLALGNAINLKNRHGFSVSVVSMAPIEAKETLLHLFDFGVDEVYLLSDKAFANSDVYATSNVLANFIKRSLNDYSYIFSGTISSDGFTGMLPGEVASKLSISYISNALGVRFNEDSLVVRKFENNKIKLLKVSDKALVSFSEKGAEKALPSLYFSFSKGDRPFKVFTKELLKLNEEEVGLEGSRTMVKDVFETDSKIINEFITLNGDQVIIDAIKKEVLK